MIRTLCRGTALYDDRRRTNLHHVGDSSKIQNELGETVKYSPENSSLGASEVRDQCSEGLWRRHGLGDLSPHGGDLQPTCAKRPAHKRTGDRDFLLPSAAQRVQLRTNTAQRVLGGVRRRVFAARRH